MKRLVLLLVVLPGIALADRAIVGDKSGTIDCAKDPEVAINSGEGTFTFTGTCTKIAVSGGHNKLTIENVTKLAIVGSGNIVAIEGADKIAVTGSDNTVTYKRALTRKKPAVASMGTKNKITQVN